MDNLIKVCDDCNCLFVGGMFCFDCGSANIDYVGNDYPFI